MRVRGGGGPVALFARHPTAGHLLMILMLLAGAVALTKLNRQFFPDFGIDVIAVSVSWPGASAEDVEANIVEAIEPEVRYLDGVKRVVATAREGLAVVNVEYEPGSDMERALAEVEQAVAQITTFPEEAERPEVRRIVRYDTIVRLVLSGPFEERALKAFAKRIRDRLLERGVDRVTLFGARSERILVEIDPRTLYQLGTDLDALAARIARSSRDIPSGTVEGALERRPRALGLARSAEEVAGIEVLARADGHRLRFADIARVAEGFDDGEPEARRGGLRAVELHVQRSLNADALTVNEIVRETLDTLRAELPPTLELERYDVLADLIRDRIRLLVENGLSGFLLVIAILFLFLNARVALWVAAGIPVSLGAMLGLLWLGGYSINMISLFAMILAIGIVVDDAIVVGEHSAALRERGVPPQIAAENGARHMVAPVTSATLTTVAAFLPLFMVGDVIGTLIREIPTVVVFVLLASLVECFFVLPAHMRSALAAESRPSRWRQRFNARFDGFREGPFRRLVALAVTWRYTTLAAAVALLVLMAGLVLGGHVGFVFFKGPESDRISVGLTMAPGVGREETEATLAAVEKALYRGLEELGARPEETVVMVLARLGADPSRVPGEVGASGDNYGAMEVELTPSDRRPVRTQAVVDAWTAALPPIPALDTLTIRERSGGPPGREVDIRLRGGESVADLKAAAGALEEALAAFPGVSQIEDDLAYDMPEIVVRLTERGRTLGFTTEEIGRQLRGAFEGAIASRFSRGDEEVEIVVRLLPEALRDIELGRFELIGADGRLVALSEVAELSAKRGFAAIRREDAAREVAVTAELDETLIRLEQLREALVPELERIAADYGLSWRFAGRAEEQAGTLADLRLGSLVALGLIYIVLAWVFGSFTRPLVVMAVVPFGVIGAVIGHLVMGYDLTILSLIALLGLSGILVNDSIILVTTIDRRLAEGQEPHRAIVEGTCSRLRAVLLTSLTTIGGLTPLLFETSFQAQFLIPMALTLVFGLAVNTFLVLLLVPALVGVQADFRRDGWKARPASLHRLEAA